VDCPADCGHYACGNGVCEPGENPQNCPEDCASICGNCECEGGESYSSCPVDCGYCGDGYCIKKCAYLIAEDKTTCPEDCKVCVPTVPSTEVCDGTDNDCDGVVDNADAESLCPSGQTCVKGMCVPGVAEPSPETVTETRFRCRVRGRGRFRRKNRLKRLRKPGKRCARRIARTRSAGMTAAGGRAGPAARARRAWTGPA